MFFDFLGRSGREILLHKDIGISRNISVKINKPLFPKFRGQKKAWTMPRLVSNLENLIFRGASPTLLYEGPPGAPGGSLPRALNKMTNIPNISLSTRFPQDTAEHQVLSLLPFPCSALTQQRTMKYKPWTYWTPFSRLPLNKIDEYR